MTRICVIVGEPSGDFLGAKLIAAIKEIRPDAVFTGVGGPQMQAAGQTSLFPYEEMAVMGLAEVLPKIPALLARVRQTIEHVKATKPDIVITIDSPDFGLRVAKAVRKDMGVNAPKLIHYIAPSVWVWREGRAEKVARFLDGLICLFDFEPPYFEKYGLRSVAVGHPLVEGEALKADVSAFRSAYGIAADAVVVGALFGSRRGELKRTAPVLLDAVFQLASKLQTPPLIVAPTLPHIKDQVAELLKEYPGTVHVTADPAEKFAAFKSMDVAVAVSGTVGLELAALQVPHLIAYRLNEISAMIARRMLYIRHVHLANIMAGREIVPEFLQDNCRADLIADKALALLQSPDVQKADMADIAQRIGAGQAQTPSQKAAAFVLSFV